MFLRNRIYIIIFSLIIFSPIFITIGDNYHLYTNRVYHLLVNYFNEYQITYIPDLNIKILFTIPLNLIFFTFISFFFIKELLNNKVILIFSSYLLFVIVLNFDFFFIFYKNAISLLVGISSILIFDAFFKKNKDCSFNDVLIFPILIVIFGLFFNFFFEFQSSYSNQIFLYFHPQFLIFNALQYFAFIFLVFSSIRYKNIFFLIFINLITIYVCIITDNLTASLLYFSFLILRFIFFFLNSKYRILFVNFLTIAIISSLFLYYFFLFIVPFDPLPLQLKDRYLIIYDFISKLDIFTIFIPIHDEYDHLTHGLHNTFLEIFSRFGITAALIYYLFLFKSISHLRDKQPMFFIMMMLLIFAASSLNTLYLHPYTLICFSYIISFFKNYRNGN